MTVRWSQTDELDWDSLVNKGSKRQFAAVCTNDRSGPEVPFGCYDSNDGSVRPPDLAHDPANVCKPQETTVIFIGRLLVETLELYQVVNGCLGDDHTVLQRHRPGVQALPDAGAFNAGPGFDCETSAVGRT